MTQIGLTQLKAALLESLYPVGSVYINATVATNPGTLMGFGTWTAFGEGRVPVGKAAAGTFATGGATGGAETHTLTTSEMPSHTHGIGGTNYGAVGGAGSNYIGTTDSTTWRGPIADAARPTGGGTAHNNLQPYVVVYMWRRTA